jgi:hypothetical protein
MASIHVQNDDGSAIPPVVALGGPSQSFAATIANGASVSGIIDLTTLRMFGLLMDPTAWTAAAITFLGSADGVNFYSVYDSTGAEINWTVAAQTYVLAANPAEFLGIRYLKVRSGTTATPVNQGAARVVTIIGVP